MTVSDLALEPFVTLAAFRRSGEAVATPVRVAADGGALVITTGAASAVVLRITDR